MLEVFVLDVVLPRAAAARGRVRRPALPGGRAARRPARSLRVLLPHRRQYRYADTLAGVRTQNRLQF